MVDRTPTATDIIAELLATPLLWSPHGPGYEHLDEPHTAHDYDSACAVCRFSDRAEARELVVQFVLDAAAGFDIVARTDLTRMTGDTSTDLRMLYAYEAGLRDGQSDADPAVCPTCGPQARGGLHVQKPPPDPRFCTDPFHDGADQ